VTYGLGKRTPEKKDRAEIFPQKVGEKNFRLFTIKEKAGRSHREELGVLLLGRGKRIPLQVKKASYRGLFEEGGPSIIPHRRKKMDRIVVSGKDPKRGPHPKKGIGRNQIIQKRAEKNNNLLFLTSRKEKDGMRKFPSEKGCLFGYLAEKLILITRKKKEIRSTFTPMRSEGRGGCTTLKTSRWNKNFRFRMGKERGTRGYGYLIAQGKGNLLVGRKSFLSGRGGEERFPGKRVTFYCSG